MKVRGPIPDPDVAYREASESSQPDRRKGQRRKGERTDGIPRTNDLTRSSAAEMAIRNAVNVVENLGCDTELTHAVCLLDEARSKVALFIDNRRTLPDRRQVDWRAKYEEARGEAFNLNGALICAEERIKELEAVYKSLQTEFYSEKERRVIAQEAITLNWQPRYDALLAVARELETCASQIKDIADARYNALVEAEINVPPYPDNWGEWFHEARAKFAALEGK